MTSRKGQRHPRPRAKGFRQTLTVPIYGCRVVVSVSDDILAARRRENVILGVDEDLEKFTDCGGLTSYCGNSFGIFFDRDIDHGVLAHELFHLTHRILNYVDIAFDPENPEPHTYLNQFLTLWTYQQLAKAKVRIHL